MEITQVRNATIIVNYNGTKFLIDPWLGPKEYMEGFISGVNSQIRQPRVELPMEINKIVNVDAVIVTHLHPDHWDEYAAKALDKNIKIFVQSECDKEFVQNEGFKNIEILNENGTEYKQIKLYKTTGEHGIKEIIEPICKQVGMAYDAMGIVFKADNEKTLYLTGDTIWCKEVEESLSKFTPAVIIANACGATVLNGERLIMNKEDLNTLLIHSTKATVIASHMDTVSHLTVTRNDLQELTDKHKNLLIPNDGEIIKL